MNLTPFTHEDATEIWDDFEDLKDTEFVFEGVEYFVQDVVICPFGEEEKAAFTARYDQILTAEEALAPYTGSEYDVMLVACDVSDESTFVYMSIRSFVAEKGINYNFPANA